MTPDNILAALGGANDEALFRRADAVRRRVFGSRVFIRAIVEFSNVCDKHCAYCGLRADNARLTRYRMAPDEILAAAHAAVDQGAGTIVLQSGDDMGYDAGTVAGLIRAIKARHDVAVTLSLGDRALAGFRPVSRHSGADRYLLKLETTDPELYARTPARANGLPRATGASRHRGLARPGLRGWVQGLSRGCPACHAGRCTGPGRALRSGRAWIWT